MELVTQAFAQSYWQTGGAGIATARTGNLIGGGDWAEDRLIPDLMRRFAAGQPPHLRNPQALRPWQYVLEVLRGYLLLAERLVQEPQAAGGAWNFGPEADGVRPVGWVAEQLARAWGMAATWSTQPGGLPQEIPMLQLDSSKAAAALNWRPLLPLEAALEATARWYRQAAEGADVRQISQALLAEYCAQIGELAGVSLLTGVDA
jgi:CDP-glucose 4,6-dehydratase